MILRPRRVCRALDEQADQQGPDLRYGQKILAMPPIPAETGARKACPGGGGGAAGAIYFGTVEEPGTGERVAWPD